MNKPQAITNSAKIESLIERMRKEEIIEVLMNIIKKDPDIISTLNLNTNVGENRKYGDQAVLPLQFEIKDYQQSKNLLTKLKGIKNTAKFYFEQGNLQQGKHQKDNFQNGLKILNIITQQSIRNYKKTYDLDGLFSEFIEECLDDFLKIELTIPQKEVFFNDFIELYLENTGGFAPSILEVILKQCATPADYTKLEKILLAKLSELPDEHTDGLIELLLALYDKKGNIKRYLEVCKNNLSNWKNCIRLCDKLEQSGKKDEAIEWYQKVIGALKEKHPKLVLKKKLTALYEKTNNVEQALNLHFEVFKEQGNLESYKKMKNLFSLSGNKWEKIRNNIVLFLAKTKRYSLLIEILLYENDIDSAAKIALLPNQRLDDIKKVAGLAKDKNPTLSLRLFKRLITYYTDLKRRDDYKTAKVYCQEVKKIYQRLNQEHLFKRYIERIKRLNAYKRLLLEELEEL
ncbi:MAG: hypothetical protein QME42_04610 [bacterium]|nr:hypothetical protein [bacterium]